MARMYSNENFPLPAVEQLRHMGHDVLTIQETGKAGISVPDEDVLALASEDDRAVVTFNRRHFVRLHGISANHAGIIVCTFDSNFSDLAARIHEQVKSLASLAGQLIRINRPTAKQK